MTMGTSLIEPRKRGSNVKALPQKMRDFCLFLISMRLWEPVEAARQAGYKSPNQTVTKLMKDKRVQAFLGKKMREREERCEHTADEVLNYLHNALFFCPGDYFDVDQNGGGFYTNSIKDLPQKVKMLIEDVIAQKVTLPDGTIIERFFPKFISRSVVLGLAMKHHNLIGTQKIDVQGKIAVDWDSMYGRTIEVDSIETMIEEVGG